MAKLVIPDARYERSYVEAVREFTDEGRADEAAVFDYSSFGAFVQHLLDAEQGIGLPDGYVAGSARWLIEGTDFIGRVDVRHELNAALRRFGGHVGYIIRPSRRRLGYGTQALALALPECQALGLQRVLVTCDLDNQASRRIIERNRGVLEDVIKNPGRQSPTMRYWIDLESVGHEPHGISA